VTDHATKPGVSEDYWTHHNVTLHKRFRTAEESLEYFAWRNAQYIDYIDLLPVAGHDGQVIVDYGCGPGNDLVGFYAYSKPTDVYGIDVSRASLDESRARLNLHGFPGKLINISSEEVGIPLADASVDYIHCSGVFMLLSDPEQTLAEFHRILKPGGYARMMVYDFDSIWAHLYVPHVLMSTDARYKDLSHDEAFKRSTDGFDCPINTKWQISGVLEITQRHGFNTKHLGNAISLFEMSLLPTRFTAMIDPEFPSQCRDFLTRIVFDRRGIPYVGDKVAGIDACFELTKPASNAQKSEKISL
jgi:ubiquinone/menaquinone biosynthesis C-methylase UbiE